MVIATRPLREPAQNLLGLPTVQMCQFGLFPRVGANQLGHAKVSMTQDQYMSRGRIHTEVAELLDRTIKDE